MERSQLKKAIAQIGLAQALSAENAPSTGKMLGAQVLVVGAVSEAGQHFVITGRAIDAQSGNVLGNAMVQAKREYCHPRFRRYRDPKYGWGCFSLHTCPGWGQILFHATRPWYSMGRGYLRHPCDCFEPLLLDINKKGPMQHSHPTRMPTTMQSNRSWPPGAHGQITFTQRPPLQVALPAFFWTANIIDAIMVASDAE